MDLWKIFNDHLQRYIFEIDTFHPFYEEALSYMLQAGGKRFRPLLLLTIVEAKNPLLIPSSLDVALALEMFHTYSLIHDDLPVMDDADLRRGYDTLHKKYDEVTATLVGDALNTHAFYLIANAALSGDAKSALVETLAANGGVSGMVHGQILDCYFEKRALSLEEVKRVHIDKTAKLIAASLKMGAIIVDMPYQEQQKLYQFGIDLGLLFQIQDDIIDALCSSEEAGKTTNNDLDKNSFVNLLGIEESVKEADTLAKSLEASLESFDEELKERLAALINQYLYRHKHLKKDRNE